MLKKLSIRVLGPLLLIICLMMTSGSALAATDLSNIAMTIPKDKVVVVIDPGHGGENKGTEVGATIEKEMTMVTALACFNELSKYDNVEVYLTHSTDTDMSLKERAQFAREVNAKYLFSIHYNASEEHTLFGSEVWVSSVEPYHTEGVRFGAYHLANMGAGGLFLRGIKTRLNDKETDYYGIIRESVDLDLTAVIIEHCHVDEERDIPFCDTREKWEALGRIDAASIAQFLGLASKELNVDYTRRGLPEGVDLVTLSKLSFKDCSEPDLCEVTLDARDEETGTAAFTVKASDHDTPILYYDYSTDGGFHYSKLQPWPDSNALLNTGAESFPLELSFPYEKESVVIVRAYNMYHAFAESNHVTVEAFHEPKATPEPTEIPDEPSKIIEIRREHPIMKVLEIVGCTFAALFVLTAIVLAVKKRK